MTTDAKLNLPWTVHQIDYSKGLDVSFEILDAKGDLIAQTIMREKGEGWRDAIIEGDRTRAALIVQSVNGRPALIEALTKIAEYDSGDDTTLGALARLAECRKIATAALSSEGAR